VIIVSIRLMKSLFLIFILPFFQRYRIRRWSFQLYSSIIPFLRLWTKRVNYV
jgi:hypothetical protein